MAKPSLHLRVASDPVSRSVALMLALAGMLGRPQNAVAERNEQDKECPCTCIQSNWINAHKSFFLEFHNRKTDDSAEILFP